MQKECQDYLNVPINIGDMIAFPASGTMMKAKVQNITGMDYLHCVNEAGNRSKKYGRDCINVTALMGAYKEIHPENCL